MENADDIFAELRDKFLPTFERSCLFWLPAQTFNFVLIPPRYRVIYMGVCGFIWVNILCWIKRQQTKIPIIFEQRDEGHAQLKQTAQQEKRK